jgi:diguanylate cyclase (GGDEF)-like protein/PAS domain S-box-containing protein
MMPSDAMDREPPQSSEIAVDDTAETAPDTALQRVLAAWPAFALALVLGGLLAMAAVGWLAWPTAFGAAAVASATAIVVGIVHSSRNARAGELLRALLARERTANARHQLAEHLGATGTWTLERRSGEERSIRMTWSPGCFRLFGWPVEQGEPPLARFVDRIHAGDRERWHLVHRRALRYGGEARIEYRFLGKGGDPVWIRSIARAERSAGGEIVRLGGVVQDITGIRAIQQRLASSEAKFRELTQLSSDWIWEADAQLRWSYLAEGAGTVLGGWTQTLPGRPLWEPPPGPRAFEQPDWDRLRSRLEVHASIEDFEYPMIDPGGQMRFVSISGRPIFTAGGEFTGYRGIGRDITQEKQQRLLLRLESEIAALVREQSDPEQVVSAVLAKLCGIMGWLGGVHLRRIAGIQACSAHECWGSAAFLRMVEGLPATLPIPTATATAEGQAWTTGRSQWLLELTAEASLAQRFQARPLGAQAIFLVPITDEAGKVASMLVCLSAAPVKAPRFFEQSAGIVSSTLSLFLQRKGAERRLTHRSLHDALTDLPNRIYLTHQLETRIARNEPAAVLYIDLDRYKIINDTLGHSVGDQVLIDVAQRLRDTIREHDVAGRMGGDEFIILLSQLADRAEIERIARRVLAAIEKPFVLMNRAYFLSASIGVAIAPDDGIDAALLIKCADSAMYRVKSEGRNDIRFFTGSLSDERSDQLALAAELPLALQRGEVDLHYQPILDVAGRRVLGFEALLRWQHPTRGLLRPDRFLAAAEQSNLIREIGFWTLRRAIDDRLELGVQAYPDAAVSVNISARQFTEDGFLGTLNAMLNERAMPPRLLQLELTESAFIGRPERTVAVIGELRRLGVRVLIDNFGTGYASLAYLKNLPVDGLKIDQGFVRGLPEDRGNAAIVQAITTLCARLGLTAIAEGVETPEELQALRSLECERLQGTLIAEPMPFARLAAFLATLPEVRRMHLVRDGGGQAT